MLPPGAAARGREQRCGGLGFEASEVQAGYCNV